MARTTNPIIKVLRLLRLDTVFEIYTNAREAQEAFADSAEAEPKEE